MPDDWKQALAVEADKALAHPLVVDVIAELRENLGVTDSGLPAYGITKVAHYAATVARAQALGIDPDLLRLSATEVRSHQLDLAARAALLGIPVHLLDTGSGDSGGGVS